VIKELHLTIAGEAVTIRPIRASDAGMESAFIRNLSPLAKHYRFLGGVKELLPSEVAELCDVDGNHSMAFVATIRCDGAEREIGVSRYCPDSKADVREISVTVADDWQHKGLGTILMKQLIQSAQENGVKRIYSVDLMDNGGMRALAKDLGMSANGDPTDPHQTIYSLAL
jgi:GNAT superfamily N-acetyltransferase